ncbi:hypothetical protein CHARACLAT_030558 [Characodon lateralis]|uniref:Uncharacterized protein n=1 Tax=Characodon lateralis TaxID=208331 RepID=A0ABU7ENQ0_9TELE|nr:hypothetical protein [Characodon lateralis]
MGSRAHTVRGGEPDYFCRYLSTYRTSSGAFPPSEVTFYVPRASLSIRPPRSPPSSAAQSSLHRPLTVPPAGGGPTGGWRCACTSGSARPGPARSNQATRRSLTGPSPGLAPGWDPGSAILGDVTCLNRIVLMKDS